MTSRDQEIDKAASKWWALDKLDRRAQYFYEGAKWADSNPDPHNGFIKTLVKLRQEVRNVLNGFGIKSNPAWSDQDVIDGLQLALTKYETLLALGGIKLKNPYKKMCEELAEALSTIKNYKCGDCDVLADQALSKFEKLKSEAGE